MYVRANQHRETGVHLLKYPRNTCVSRPRVVTLTCCDKLEVFLWCSVRADGVWGREGTRILTRPLFTVTKALPSDTLNTFLIVVRLSLQHKKERARKIHRSGPQMSGPNIQTIAPALRGGVGRTKYARITPNPAQKLT